MTVTTVRPAPPIFVAGRWVASPDVLEIANSADPVEPVGATCNAGTRCNS